MPPQSPPRARPQYQVKGRILGGVDIASIVLLFLLLPFTALAAFMGMFLGLGAGPSWGNSPTATEAAYWATVLPLVSTLVVIVLTVVLIALRKMALWVPILGYVLLVVIFCVAFYVA